MNKISSRIQFKSINEYMSCPVCGYSAKIIQTSPARDWAELNCENCRIYSICDDALDNVGNLYLFSGYVRHHQPDMMTVQCHDKKSVLQITSMRISRDEQMKYLLSFYYQKMTSYGEFINYDSHPAIAYAKDEEDLRNLMQCGVDCGYLLFENEMISVTENGKRFMDEQESRKMMGTTASRPKVFISYNHESKELADKIESHLDSYADVVIDKNCIKPWGSIKEFMNSIRDQDFAVLIISDSYLKSTACLYEVMQMMKEKDWDERVMYVVTDDAHGVYDTRTQINYIAYWEEQVQRLQEAIKGHNPAVVSHQAEELKKISLISFHIGEFLIKLKDANNPSVDDSIEMIRKRVIDTSSGVSGMITLHERKESEDNNGKGYQEITNAYITAETELYQNYYSISMLLYAFKNEGCIEVIHDILHSNPYVSISGVELPNNDDNRESSFWIGGVKLLHNLGMISLESDSYYRLTDDGYNTAEHYITERRLSDDTLESPLKIIEYLNER